MVRVDTDQFYACDILIYHAVLQRLLPAPPTPTTIICSGVFHFSFILISNKENSSFLTIQHLQDVFFTFFFIFSTLKPAYLILYILFLQNKPLLYSYCFLSRCFSFHGNTWTTGFYQVTGYPDKESLFFPSNSASCPSTL